MVVVLSIVVAGNRIAEKSPLPVAILVGQLQSQGKNRYGEKE